MECRSTQHPKGANIQYFGTETHVKLPGPAPKTSTVRDFRTYEQTDNSILGKEF